MPLPNGSTFAGFTIVRPMGAGALGEVYLVEHSPLSRQECLEVLPGNASDDAEFRERFFREADLAASLDHPHILRIREHGEHGGRLWIVKEFVDGPDAGRLLRKRYQGGMPPTAVFNIVTAVAQALDYAHQHALLHRNVNPSSIVLAKADPAGRQILLGDFGAGRSATYAAPELLTGQPDGRVDQYALAATAFHLLTGSPPSPDDDPTTFGAATGRALSKDPAARYDTCLDFAAALVEGGVRTQGLPVTSSGEVHAVPPTDGDLGEAPPVFVSSLGAEPEQPTEDNAASASVGAARPKRNVPTPPSSDARRTPHELNGEPPKLATVVAVVAMILLLTALSVWFVRDRYRSHAASPTTAPAPTSTAPVAALPPPAPPLCGEGDALLAALSPREKLAQLLMVGVTGADDARSVVLREHVGGIMIGSWTDLAMLGDPLKEIAASSGQLPLAVSTDEEGGRVSRLSSKIGKQDSARVLAQTVSSKEVYDIAFKRGQAMKNLGITIDFAPVVDVSDQPDDTVIGDRSFSNNPAKVTDYAGAYAQGLRDAGILPVLKHFPGHGHASGDSHTGGVSTPPLSALLANDLIPYRTLTTQAPVAVMVGHLDVPGLTTDYPASLAPQAYALLRSGEYGGPPFGGPVFTDDLSSMRAISDRFGVAEAALRALQAGADVALWITTDEVPAVLNRLVQALDAKELDIDRVNDSVLRIAAAKGKSPHCGG